MRSLLFLAQTAAADGFEPVTGAAAAGESIPASSLVGAAYGFIWLALAAYLLYLWRRTRALESEIESLTRRTEVLTRR